MNDAATSSTNLERLLSLIRAEGLEKAKTEADRIVADAKAEARRITENAKAEARQAQREAQLRIERSETAQHERLSMAARDLVLQLSEQLTQGFERFTAHALEASLSPDLLATFLEALAQSCAGSGHWSAQMAPADLEALEKALSDRFSQELKAQVKAQGSEEVKAGLLLYEEGATSFLDFSAPALAQRLTRHLSPKLKQLWSEATQDMGGPQGES